jgi:hypothetical protein
MRKADIADAVPIGGATVWKSRGALTMLPAMLRKFMRALAIGVACSGAATAEPRSGAKLAAIDPSVRPQQAQSEQRLQRIKSLRR